jgi:DNA (cytosine-5)-methyltransferase 3A
MKPLNVLSLFDGISCAQIALGRAGFKVANYFASEIEVASMKVTQYNYPNTIQLGDVTKIRATDLPKIDLLVGGSPCQGFSFAGKMLNFSDERSKLFFEYVRLLKECKPKYFLLENVRMKKEHQDVISEQLGVRPVLINSSVLSAQSRNRLYWSNVDIDTPVDLNLVTEDIVDSDGPFKYLDDLATLSRNYTSSSVFYDFRKPISQSQRRQAAYLTKKHMAITCGDMPAILTANGRIRKTTLLEQERLQTVPDNYTSCVCQTARHKSLGNGFTVDVIAHIFSCIRWNKTMQEAQNAAQLSSDQFEDLII